MFTALHPRDGAGAGAVARERGVRLLVGGGVGSEEADFFAEERPDTREVGNVDGDRAFAYVPEHVGCIVDVFKVKVFCKDCGNDLPWVSYGSWRAE